MRYETGLRATTVRYASVSSCIAAVQRTDGHGRQGWERCADRSRSRRQAAVGRHHQHRGQEGTRAREHEGRRQQTGKRSNQPARIVEGRRVMGWREALNELATAYPGRLRQAR
jgi:hypothetical protein